MSATTPLTADPVAGRELTISRLVNAPRSLVWDVWTQPEHIRHWWGPNGFRSSILEMDVQPGGVWDFIMHGPDGTDYKNKSVYKEVVKYEKLVYDHISGPKFQFTVTFTGQGNQTLISIQMLFDTPEQLDAVVKTFNAAEGLKQNMDKLDVYLVKGYPSDAITFTRLVKAPRELVFKAWTDPKMLAKWWGPNGFSNPVCEFEPAPGGRIYICMKAPDGTEYPMDGEVLAVTPPERLEFISAALDENNNRLFRTHNILTLTEESGETRLTLEVKVNNVTPGAEMYLKGMNEGWSQSLERLLNLVE